MKKKFPIKILTINRGKPFYFTLFCTLSLAMASTLAEANTEIDRRFQLETIGILKPWDNIDGIFSEPLNTAYQQYFSNQNRFIVNSLSQADPVLSKSNIPYLQLIQDPEVLGQIAKSTRTESMIRTKIVKEGNQYTISLDWLHSPKMEIIASTQMILTNPSENSSFQNQELAEKFRSTLKQLFAHIPFQGHVTGRDQANVTVNLGSTSLRKGDVLLVKTIDEVKKHPLLHSIVEWKMSPTGKLLVEQVEDGMAFCKILEEEPGKEIGRYQKITKIEQRTEPATPSSLEKPESSDSSSTPEDPALYKTPTLGWMAASLPIGAFSRESSSPASTFAGGGLSIGAKVDTEAWFTKDWFMNLSLGYSFGSLSQNDRSTNLPSAFSSSGGGLNSVFQFKVNLGYNFFLQNHVSGPKAWIKVGYKSVSYTLPVFTAENLGPLTVGSVFTGVGGEIPIRGNWGILAHVNFRLFSGANITWTTNPIFSNISDADFYIGASYKWTPRLVFRAGFQVDANSVELADGMNINQNTMTIGPSVLYYF